jgi:hypothetical protein
MPSAARIVLMVLVLVVAAALLGHTPRTPADAPSAGAEGCGGTAAQNGCRPLLGVSTQFATSGALAAAEQTLGRRVDIVYRFHDLDDAIPDEAERRATSAGRTLHVSVDSRIFGSSGTVVRWADVAAGAYDDVLSRQARGIAGLPGRVFVTFEHEPEQAAKANRGTPQDYVAAWRHVHQVFDSQGATNVTWVWVVMGWLPGLQRAALMWPGNAYVDWVGFDAYNGAGCGRGAVDVSKWRSFTEAVAPPYQWLVTHGPSYGIEADTPLMIGETGSVPHPSEEVRTADWFAQIPASLQSLPRIRAVTFWDSVIGACDFRLRGSAVVGTALRRAAAELAPPASRTRTNTQSAREREITEEDLSH